MFSENAASKQEKQINFLAITLLINKSTKHKISHIENFIFIDSSIHMINISRYLSH